MANNTIEECVRRHAVENPNKVAIVCGEASITYAELWDRVTLRSQYLQRQGFVNGRLYIFRSKQNADFIIDYLAVHLAGAVAVPIERDCPEEKYHCLQKEYGDISLSPKVEESENIADILFTTGSTGQQKGVMESYRAIWADADNLIHAQGFTGDTVFIICGPLNHIGCLSKIWPTLILGGTLVILDGMKDMNAFFHAFDYPDYKFATFMVPASIRMVLQFGAERIRSIANKIDFVETGGAAISQTDMDALCQLLPKSRLYNTYASTETGIVCTYDYNHNPCVAGCTGVPMKNSSVFITSEGNIACKGMTLMSGYLKDYELTRTVLHDGTVFTNDIGDIDENGYLHIKGRNNDVINLGGYKVSPLEVEDATIAYPKVTDCICIPFHSPIFGDTIKLLYTAEEENISKRELAKFIANRLETYKVPKVFQQVSSIKHTYNGKLDRKYYNAIN